MKARELREKSVEELMALLDEKQLHAFRLRMSKATGQLFSTHEIGINRREIARLYTLINEKRSQV